MYEAKLDFPGGVIGQIPSIGGMDIFWNYTMNLMKELLILFICFSNMYNSHINYDGHKKTRYIIQCYTVTVACTNNLVLNNRIMQFQFHKATCNNICFC